MKTQQTIKTNPVTINFETWAKPLLDKGYTVSKAFELYKLECVRLSNLAAADTEYKPQLIANMNFDDLTHEINNITPSTYSYAKYEPTKSRYNNAVDFIAAEYTTITKALLKSMYKCIVVTKAGKTVSPYYDTLHIIVESGYNYSYFDDIQQTVACFLLENIDLIKSDNNDGHYNIMPLWLELFKLINRWLYSEVKRKSNTEVCIIDYDEETGDAVTLAINSKAFHDYVYNSMGELNTTELSHIVNIAAVIIAHIHATEKPKAAAAICDYFKQLLKGYSIKEAAKSCEISNTTATKYNKIIRNAYNIHFCYHAKAGKHEKQNQQQTGGEKLTIDYHFEDAYKCMQAIANREHNEKQALYNSLWGLTSKDNKPKQNMLQRVNSLDVSFYNQSIRLLKLAKYARMDTYIY